MKKLFAFAGLACTLMFVACGGDSGTSADSNTSADDHGKSSSSAAEVKSSSSKENSGTESNGNENNASSSSKTENTANSSAAAPSSSIVIPGATITDSRDGQTYAVYKNATQYWISENMRYDAKPNGCYNNAEDNCTKFGLWYSWDAAQNVCPEGWRLPYGKDWRTLGKLNSNKSLTFGVTSLFSTENLYVRLTGAYYTIEGVTEWRDANEDATYWDAEDLSDKYAGYTFISKSSFGPVDYLDGNYLNMDKRSLLAVRCILENHGTMVDPRDGQSYKTIRIGNKVWMAENLNYDAEGSIIRDDIPNDGLKYGRLYKYASAKTACPSGWHLSTASDWKPIYDIVDSVIFDGISLKSMTGWNESHSGKDDFEMNIVPVGNCYYDTYDNEIYCTAIGEDAQFWMDGGSTNYQGKNALTTSSGDTDVDYLSVRCVMDK